MIDDNMSFTILNDKGEETVCDVLFTFDNTETGKSYIVYTDNDLDEEGNTKVYASVYNPNCEEQELLPVETEKEWQTIEAILEELRPKD
jgi:uncharacterized protein YrzB (UPF0473 family)